VTIFAHYGGLSGKVVTVVTERKFSFVLCVTSLVKKVVTPARRWLQTGNSLVTKWLPPNLAIKLKRDYVNWLQSGYALIRRKERGCNQFFSAVYTLELFGGEK
jgi:hypothetical protein